MFPRYIAGDFSNQSVYDDACMQTRTHFVCSYMISKISGVAPSQRFEYFGNSAYLLFTVSFTFFALASLLLNSNI